MRSHLEPYLRLWTKEERDWAEGLYFSPGFQSVRERFIEISRALDTTRPGPEDLEAVIRERNRELPDRLRTPRESRARPILCSSETSNPVRPLALLR